MGGEVWSASLPQSQRMTTASLPVRDAGLFPVCCECLTTDAARELPARDKRRLMKDISETVWGLNWLHGEFSRTPARQSTFGRDAMKQQFLHGRTQQRIEHAAFKALRCDSALSPQEAIGSLLKGRTPYSCLAQSSVVPVEIPKVALPEDVSTGPFLDELLASRDSHLLDGGFQAMLRTSSQVSALEEALGAPNSYMDEKLARSNRLYAKFISKCMKIGIITLSLTAKSVQGVFFVRRKDGRQRMIVDCRRANRMFLDPPGTDLITGEGLGELEIQDEDFLSSGLCLFFGCADVDSCFHRLRLRGELCKYFCWEPIAARHLKISNVEGQPVSPDQEVYPMQVCLPMGFSWATYLAQSVTSSNFERSIPPTISQPLSDKTVSKVLTCQPGHTCHYTYIDNFGVIGVSQSDVTSILGRAEASFNSKNLLLHELNVEAGGAEALGMVVDCTRFETYNSAKRFGRIRKSLTYILNQRTVAGWVVEVLVGHCTYFALVNRDLLSIFSATYAFIRKHYTKAATLWKSVQCELRAFRGLMVFASARWTDPWSPKVYACDSSLTGFGIQSAVWDSETVAQVGRVKEKSRWRLGAESARHKSLEAAGYLLDDRGKIEKDEEGNYIYADSNLLNQMRAD